MTSLTEFLLARLAEDEAVARRMRDWGWVDGLINDAFRDNFDPADLEDEPDSKDCAKTIAQLAGWFKVPARVLAEVEALRAVVALHGPETLWCSDGYVAGSTHEDVRNVGTLNGEPCGENCPTLKALTQPHRDHPDFDPSWLT